MNSFKELEDSLCYEHKTLEDAGYGKRKTSRRKVRLFTVQVDTPRVIKTAHGFLDRVLGVCKKYGYAANVMDGRLYFPEPKRDKAFGFRFSQADVFKRLLDENRSGICCAPTRWGKSSILINLLRVYPGMKTVVAAPGRDLLNQLYDAVKAQLTGRDVKLIHSQSRHKYPSDDITICSFDSLKKCDHEGTKLLLIDEPHEAVTEKRAPMLQKFWRARKLAVGATPTGRYDGADALIEGLIGPVLVEKTYTKAVKEGSICPINVLILRIPANPANAYSRNQAYARMLWGNPKFADYLQEISRRIIPSDWQSLVFIDNQKQAEMLHDYLPEARIAMDKLMTAKQRKEVFAEMAAGNIKRCLSSDIYRAGVTFSDLRVVVNAAGGGANISCIQKPGRLAEVRDGKTCGVVFDFLFVQKETDHKFNEGPKTKVNAEGWMPFRDSVARMNMYKKKGYGVYVVDTLEELKARFEVTAHSAASTC